MAAGEAVKEARRLEEGLSYYEHLHRLSATRWRTVNACLTIVAVGLGALSGVFQTGDDGQLAGTVTAVLAGVFAGLLGLYSPRDIAAGHARAAMDCNSLRIEVRQARLMHLPTLTQDAAYEWLRSFSARRERALSRHPSVSQRLFKKARTAIEDEGTYMYGVDAEEHESATRAG